MLESAQCKGVCGTNVAVQWCCPLLCSMTLGTSEGYLASNYCVQSACSLPGMDQTCWELQQKLYNTNRVLSLCCEVQQGSHRLSLCNITGDLQGQSAVQQASVTAVMRKVHVAGPLVPDACRPVSYQAFCCT